MKSDLEELQGTWFITSLEVEGRQYPPGGAKIVIDGDRFVSLNMGAEYEGTVTVDPTRIPHTFDLFFTSGPEAGNSSPGIYELDGDTWKICLTIAGKKRPSEFSAGSGSGCALEILRRGAEI